MTPEEFNAARVKIAAEGRYDPLLFAERAWAWGKGNLAKADIRRWQADIFDRIAKHLSNPKTRFVPLRIAVASGHGIGKSAGIGMLTSWALSCYRDPRIVITANTEQQLVTKTSPEVGQWVSSSMFADLFDISTMSVKMKSRPDQHRADFVTWSETNTEAFAGLHARGRIVLLIMDEASGIPDKIFEVAEGAMTDEDTVLIHIAFGNPTMNTGAFREAFRKNRSRWITRNIDSRAVEGTNKIALQHILDTYGEHSDTAKVRVKGQFPSAAALQFISSGDVDQAFGRHYPQSSFSFAPVVIGVDPAWTGADDMVIVKRQGLASYVLRVIPKNDNDWEMATLIANLENEHKADQVFIDGGYGTGIYSAGKTMGRDWKLVWFGGESPDPGIVNMRAYMWKEMRDWIKHGGAIPRDQLLYEDLISVETKPDVRNGRVQLISKEDMKKKGLPSPNRADALALTFAASVERKTYAPVGPRQAQRDYIPPKDEVFDPYGGAR
jgi:hypothetical protein